uniref:Uncharacterized protein n=1 Tax=Glossina morsitans morsitans TaxID=37546 RepID=A0A1B0G0Y7_GLOMM
MKKNLNTRYKAIVSDGQGKERIYGMAFVRNDVCKWLYMFVRASACIYSDHITKRHVYVRISKHPHIHADIRIRTVVT